MSNSLSLDELREYVLHNEVVYQISDGLVEVSNYKEAQNRKELLDYFNDTTSIVVCSKGQSSIKNEFTDLDTWSTEDDVLFLLEGNNVLICVPKKEAIKNKLITT